MPPFALRLAAIALLAQQGPASPSSGPRIESDSSRVDFGEIYRGETARHAFTITNTGTGDLVIQQILSTCACMAANVTIGGQELDFEALRGRRPVGTLRPGEHATLEAQLLTTKLNVPAKALAVSKELHVMSNDGQHERLVLTLEANVVAPFTIERESFDFGKVRRGTPTTLAATVASDRLGDFVVTGVRVPDDAALKVECTRNEDVEGRPPSYRVAATVPPTAPLGAHAGFFKLLVDHERVKEIVLPFAVTVEPNVTFTSSRTNVQDQLDFGLLGGDEDATLELRIENGDAAVPYVPASVTAEAKPSSEAFKTELVELEKGLKYVVKLTVSKSLRRAHFFDGNLVIRANHPDLPLKKVHFRGWFKKNT